MAERVEAGITTLRAATGAAIVERLLGTEVDEVEMVSETER